MNTTLRAFIILIIFSFCVFSFTLYFIYKKTELLDFLNINYARMFVILSLTFFFYFLLIFVPFKSYKQIVKLILVSGTILWLLWYYRRHFKFIFQISLYWDIYDGFMLIFFTILGPSLSIFSIYCVRKIGSKHNEIILRNKIHVHENVFALILIFLSVVLSFYGSWIIYLFKPFDLLNISSFFPIFVIVLLFFGSFFFFRDWNDVINLKFFEIRKNDFDSNNVNERTLDERTPVNLEFFSFPKIPYFLIGFFIINIGVNSIVFGSTFLPTDLFFMDNQTVINLGILIFFISSGMIGRDWLRIMKKFHPLLYEELITFIEKQKSTNIN